MRRRAPRDGAAARPSGSRHRGAQCLRLGRCALLRVRPGDLRLDPARSDRAVAAAARFDAALRRRDVHRARDDRRRRNRGLAADPALSPARRQRLAAAHANRVLPRGVCERGPARTRHLADARRPRDGRAAVPDRAHRLRLLRDDRHRRRARAVHEGVRGSCRAARDRRREPRAGQPAHHSGHAGRRAGRRPERRGSRPQRAGHAAPRRIRQNARRHAARRIQQDAARLLAALAGGLHRGAAAVQGGVVAAPAARAARAHRFGPERRHADLSRGSRTRAERGAADEARRARTPHRVDRARGSQSAFRDQPGGATPRGRRRRPACRRTIARHDPQQREADRPDRRRSPAAQPPRPPATRNRRPRGIRSFADRRDRPGREHPAEIHRHSHPRGASRPLRPRPLEPDLLEPRAQRVAALSEEGRQHPDRRAPRLHGRCDHLRARRRRPGHRRRTSAARSSSPSSRRVPAERDLVFTSRASSATRMAPHWSSCRGAPGPISG